MVAAYAPTWRIARSRKQMMNLRIRTLWDLEGEETGRRPTTATLGLITANTPSVTGRSRLMPVETPGFADPPRDGGAFIGNVLRQTAGAEKEGGRRLTSRTRGTPAEKVEPGCLLKGGRVCRRVVGRRRQKRLTPHVVGNVRALTDSLRRPDNLPVGGRLTALCPRLTAGLPFRVQSSDSQRAEPLRKRLGQ